MAIIDQAHTWKTVEERLAVEPDPVLRRNLGTLLQHMKAEAAVDMEKLMATVSENARYQNFAQGGAGPVGKAEVEKFYTEFAATGAGKLQHDLDRLIVDKHCLLTEGIMRMAWPGKTLIGMGIEVDDPDADYLYETRMAILWPLDENGLFIGEDTYVGGDGFEGIADRKIDPDDIVPYRPAATEA